MTDQHILNVIKMLDRQLEHEKMNMPYPSFNGEMAQFCAEIEFEAFQESTVDDHLPIYKDLMDEAYRRNIR